MLNELKPILLSSGLKLEEAQFLQLEVYFQMLLEWNQRMDLTNVAPEDMARRHFADSILALLKADWFPMGARTIDVGSGAGFPGMVLAVCRPDLQMCLLDAQRKRCDFLVRVSESLALGNLTVMHGRAEDHARLACRESFDLAIARAVAPLRVLAEFLLPFVRVGGRALCWKGPSLQQELAQAKVSLKALGGADDGQLLLPLPDEEHYVISIRKVWATPAKYPRRAGAPAKNPL